VSDPRKYLIVIERADDGGYGAWAPDLPGCVALGDSIAECEQSMREAIALHLAGMREDGDPIPEPSTVATAVVEIDAA
jgi:predicted RNase H-like HicB family nuclease